MDLSNSKSQGNTVTYAIYLPKKSSLYEESEKPALGGC